MSEDLQFDQSNNGNKGEKVARSYLDPEEIVSAQFTVGDNQEPVQVVLLPQDVGTEAADHVVGVTESMDDQGNRTKRYFKVPSRVWEAGKLKIQVYDSREKLRIGLEASAVIAGAVVVGSLFVKRRKQHH